MFFSILLLISFAGAKAFANTSAANFPEVTELPLLENLNMKKPEEIKPVDKRLSLIGGVIELPIYSFYLGRPNIHGKAYVPNFSVRLGPQIMYKKMGLRATAALPIPSREIERRGESDQRNLIFSFYWRQHALDLYYQYFRGFYVSNPLTELDLHKPDRFTQFPEAESMHWGLNWYYNVDPQQFSMNSAFDQTENELKAGATWVLIPFYRHWKMTLGDRIVPGTDPDDLQTMPDLATGRFDTLGSSLAYAQTWTYQKYYLSILGGLGPGLQSQHYHDGTEQQDKLSLAAKLNFNGSIGLKPNDYMMGVNFQLDSIYSQIADMEVYSSFVSVGCFFNKKF